MGRKRQVIFEGAVIMKIQKGQVIEELAYEAKPGAGAIEFMSELIEQYFDEYLDEEILIRDIEEDKPELFAEKRVRRCCACGHYFRDKSKNNSAVTCSDNCRSKKNVYLRNIKRREQRQAEGTSHLSRDMYYNDDHGYWTEEQAMIQSDQRHIVNTSDFEKTVARSQRRQQIGGKKRVTSQNIDDIQSTTTRRSREFWGTTWATAYDDEK